MGQLKHAALLLFAIAVTSGCVAAEQAIDRSGIKDLKQLGAHYYWEIKDYKTAEDICRQIVELSTTDRDKGHYTYWIAMCLHAQGRYKEAVDMADVAINFYGYPVDYSYYMKAFCYYRLGQFNESLKWYNRLLDEFRETGIANDARLQKARVLFFSKRYAEARDAFHDLLDHHPEPELEKEAETNIETIEKLFWNRP